MRLILPFVSLALLASATTIKALQPNHAVAGLRVVPNNLTIMTPRDPGTMLEHQVFDFGSPNRFLALRRLVARQGCNAGFDVCQNDPTTCCQLGGDCCGGGVCCEAGSFCYGDGCCASNKKGCDSRGCCDQDADCCPGGGCCASGSHCVTIDGELGCCPNGQTCLSEPTTPAPVPSPSSIATTVQQGTETATPLPGTSATRTVTAQTSSRAQTSAEVPLPPRPTSGTRSQTTLTGQTTQASGSGVALAQTQSASNVGAIVGGTVAGAVALVVTLIFLILWRRKRTIAGAESEAPPDGLGPGAPYKHAYSPEVVPHTTPGTVDPFLTPMSQLPNPGISYFGGAIDRPASGAGSAPQYSGLPEPQHGDDLGSAMGTSTMPVPRHDIHHPHPLPMSVTPLREPDAESGPTRVWSGFSSRPPSAQNPAQGGRNTPYETPSRWSNHETVNTNSAHSNPPDAGNSYDLPPPRAPSTIYQPSSLGGGLDGNSNFYSPPASPPPESLYPQAIPTNIGGLPIGAAPPVVNFVPTEKSLY